MDKYEFFLRATGLKRAETEYKESKEILDNTRANVELIQESLDIKKIVFVKCQEDLRKFMQTEEFENEKRLLQAKKYWVAVRDIENIVSKEASDRDRLKKAFDKAVVEQSEAQKNFEDSLRGDEQVYICYDG